MNQTTVSAPPYTRTRARIAALLRAIGYTVGRGEITHRDGRTFVVLCLVKRA